MNRFKSISQVDRVNALVAQLESCFEVYAHRWLKAPVPIGGSARETRPRSVSRGLLLQQRETSQTAGTIACCSTTFGAVVGLGFLGAEVGIEGGGQAVRRSAARSLQVDRAADEPRPRPSSRGFNRERTVCNNK